MHKSEFLFCFDFREIKLYLKAFIAYFVFVDFSSFLFIDLCFFFLILGNAYLNICKSEFSFYLSIQFCCMCRSDSHCVIKVVDNYEFYSTSGMFILSEDL